MKTRFISGEKLVFIASLIPGRPGFLKLHGAKKSALLLFILLSIMSIRAKAQLGVLTGTGMSKCQEYSFGICPGTAIQSPNYTSEPYNCDTTTHESVSFNVLGSMWRVEKLSWRFTSTGGCNAQVVGTNSVGASVTYPFSAGQTLTPISYASISGTVFVSFAINGSPIGVTLDRNTFQISLTCGATALSPNTLTLCTESASNIAIYPLISGSTYTNYSWSPGSGTTPTITVSPTTTTVYSVTASSGTCSSATTVTVVVKKCSGGCCLGNLCGDASNPLAGHYEIQNSTYDFNFTGDNIQQDKVQVGVSCSTQLPGKFNVSTSVASDPNNNMVSTSIYGINNNSQSNYNSTGVSGNAISAMGATSTDNRGVSGYGEGAGRAIGVYGEASRGGSDCSGQGIVGNYGGYFVATDRQESDNYGVYAIALGSEDGTCNTYAGYFEGDIMVTGTPYSTAGGPFTASDIRFKKDLKQLSDASEKLSQIKGYTYHFKTEEFKDKHFSSEEQIGFIAQDLKKVFPQLVSEKGGYNYVNYAGLVPVLLEGFKEQQSRIDDLQKQLDELKQNCAAATTNVNSQDAVQTGFQMAQNEPNPFTHETVVKYTLPSTVSDAYMAVYDLTGKQVTTFPIREKGTASISITSEKLSAGIYIYSIVADGKVMDSKRMIVAEK